jgi:NADPH:quinone reductase-like Zn-dependent oxidoreductase
MRAMVVGRYGAPEVFESKEVADPQPKAGEALIRVKAVGINFADLLQRMGIYPGTPGPPLSSIILPSSGWPPPCQCWS